MACSSSALLRGGARPEFQPPRQAMDGRLELFPVPLGLEFERLKRAKLRLRNRCDGGRALRQQASNPFNVCLRVLLGA